MGIFPCSAPTVQIHSATDIIWWISQAHTGLHWRKQTLLCLRPLRCTIENCRKTPPLTFSCSSLEVRTQENMHTLLRNRRRLGVKWCSRGGYNIKSHYPKLGLQKGWAIGAGIKAAFSRRFVLTQGSNNLTRAITPFPRQPWAIELSGCHGVRPWCSDSAPLSRQRPISVSGLTADLLTGQQPLLTGRSKPEFQHTGQIQASSVCDELHEVHKYSSNLIFSWLFVYCLLQT